MKWFRTQDTERFGLFSDSRNVDALIGLVVTVLLLLVAVVIEALRLI